MSDYEGMLRQLMTAVDSHRLVTHFDREHRGEHDEKLYATVRAIRKALA
jgi:hypothetical protein